jgi:glycosyltransferase involved in cell wall biosynthesis
MYFSMPFIGRYSKLPKCVYLGEPHRPFYEALPELPWIALPEGIRRGWDLYSIKKRVRNRFDLAQFRREAREELENARAFDRILVNSYFSRESVLRAYGLNSDVCYLGIDGDRFRDLGLTRERFVIGLGTIGPTKNVRLAIESIGAMRDPKPPLVWVGNMSDDVYVPQMKELAAKLRVDFQPKVMVSDDELLQLLNRASLMLYAPRLEPFGLAPLEANACGLPVVAVAEGGVRETVIDGVNGRLLPHDPEAIGAAIEALLSDRVESAKMGEAAKQLVAERWSMKTCVDNIENAIERTFKTSCP